MLAAHEFAPQVSDITLTAAQGLIRRQRYDYAASLLRPLAGDPHGGGAAKAAKSLLGDLAARTPSSAP